MMTDFSAKFKSLIEQAEFKKAFQLAEQYLKEHPNGDILNELLLLKNRFSLAEKGERLGTVSYNDLATTKNQIGISLLELKFEEDNNDDVSATAGAEPYYADYEPQKRISDLKNMQETINIMQTTIGFDSLRNDSEKEKQKILFLAANPLNMGQLRLEREFNEIYVRFQESLDNFTPLQNKEKLTPRNIQDFLLEINPHILHFSGHGKPSSETEKQTDSLIIETIEKEGGLVLSGENGEVKIIDTTTLDQLFEIITSEPTCNLKIIVLNACFSAYQAAALKKHVPYVIGMKKEINDLAAIEFSVGFYRGIAANRSVEMSFKLAKNQMRLQGFVEDSEIPTLY